MIVTYKNPDGDTIYTDYISIYQKSSSGLILKEDGGYILTERIDRLELES
jgi:hypothetical protein